MERRYTIEPHGEAGNFALYLDRDNRHHGLRLLNLNDGGSNMRAHLALIERALNEDATLRQHLADAAGVLNGLRERVIWAPCDPNRTEWKVEALKEIDALLARIAGEGK